MFKDVVSGLSKFFTRDKVIVFIAMIILAYAMFSYSDSKQGVYDSMEDGSSVKSVEQAPSDKAPAVAPVAPSAGTPGYSEKKTVDPSDLLPTDENSMWSALNPVSMNQGNVLMPDLLQAGYHIGLDTIGQTLRNANLQLRSDPIIPKTEVGPWMKSTIEPDLMRVPLEIGVGPR